MRHIGRRTLKLVRLPGGLHYTLVVATVLTVSTVCAAVKAEERMPATGVTYAAGEIAAPCAPLA